MSTGPVHWTWREAEGVMIPLPRYLPRLRKHLKDGDLVVLEAVDVVQQRADKGFHWQLGLIFKSLPDDPSGEGRSSYDDFRRFCLIRTGWYYDKVYAYDSDAARDAILASIGDNLREFHLVEVTDDAVTVRRPLSQKIRGGMTTEERKKSYDDVITYALGIIGSDPIAFERFTRLEQESTARRAARHQALEYHGKDS